MHKFDGVDHKTNVAGIFAGSGRMEIVGGFNAVFQKLVSLVPMNRPVCVRPFDDDAAHVRKLVE